MFINQLKIIFVCFSVIILNACGGSSDPGPDGGKSSGEGYKSYEEFYQTGGELAVNLSISTPEAVLQLAYMVRDHYLQATKQESLICRHGRASHLETDLPLLAGTKLEVNLTNCFDEYVSASINGSYSYTIDSIEQQSVKLTATFEQLQIRGNAEEPIKITGSIQIESIITPKLDTLTVKLAPNGRNFQIRFDELNATETITALDVTKSNDYTTGKYSVSGNFNTDSQIVGQSFSANFETPLSGYLNTEPKAGKLKVTGLKSDVNIRASSSGYQVYVDLFANGAFEQPTNPEFKWLDILEGMYFYDRRTARYYNPEIELGSPLRFSIDGITGAYSGDQYHTLYVLPKNELSIFLIQAVDLSADNTISMTDLDTNEIIDLAYEITGNYITLKFDLQHSKRYQLKMSLQSHRAETITFQRTITVINPLLAVVDAPAFVESGSFITLDAGSFSKTLAKEITSFNWKQLSGPSVEFSSEAVSISFKAPDITSPYQEMSFLLEIEDDLGHKTDNEYKFLVIQPELNRSVVYMPYNRDIDRRVLLIEDFKAIIKEQESLFEFSSNPWDQSHGISTSVNASFAEGDSHINFSEFIDADISEFGYCHMQGATELRKILGGQLIAKDVKRNASGEITTAKYHVNRVCNSNQKVQMRYGVYVKPKTFSVVGSRVLPVTEQALFEVTGTLDFEVEGSEALSIEMLEANKFSVTLKEGELVSKPSITVYSDGVIETIELDVIDTFEDKAFLYLEHSRDRNHYGAPPLVTYSHVLSTTDAINAEFKLRFSPDLDIRVQGSDIDFDIDINFPSRGIISGETIIVDSALGNPGLAIRDTCSGDGWYILRPWRSYVENDRKYASSLVLDFYLSCNSKGDYVKGAIRLNTSTPLDLSLLKPLEE